MSVETINSASINPPSPPKVEGADLAQTIKNLVYGELNNILTDVEFRLGQTAEINRRTLAALGQLTGEIPEPVAAGGPVFAEDMNLLRHQLTGYTVTPNSPGAGSIAWASLHVVYAGTDYNITNGNTALKYAWFDAAVSTTALQMSNTKPTLTGNAALLFINNAGTPIDVLLSTMPAVVANNAVDTAAIQPLAITTGLLAGGAVTAAKTDFAATYLVAIQAAQSAADLAQQTADGAIVTYFQEAAPWANGSTQPDAKVGDVWYKASTGAAYRWSGSAGSPANTWVEIVDTQSVAALAAANAAQGTADSKITTFYAVNASPPTAISIGDLWVVTDKGNLIRRATAKTSTNWVDLTIGTDAIGTGAVTDAKVANGIGGGKLSPGTVGGTQLGAGAVSPSKLNIFRHEVY